MNFKGSVLKILDKNEKVLRETQTLRTRSSPP